MWIEIKVKNLKDARSESLIWRVNRTETGLRFENELARVFAAAIIEAGERYTNNPRFFSEVMGQLAMDTRLALGGIGIIGGPEGRD